MSVNILLNLLGELRKEIECNTLLSIVSLFYKTYDKFNNTEA